MTDQIQTPYYLIDENRILNNLKIIQRLEKHSGARAVLALKCFACWGVFDMMRPCLAGTTSSSLYEARLGYEKFGKEVHAYSVAFDEQDIPELVKFSNKIIFNSVSQLERFLPMVKASAGSPSIGLRINPKISFSHYDIADPARRYSRLGEWDRQKIEKVLFCIDGAMLHFNCENGNFQSVASALDKISDHYRDVLKRLTWVSLGGGIHFTGEGYPVEDLAECLRKFQSDHDVQVYLEPGEAVITGAGWLVTRVLDIIHNEIDIAIVDSSIEAHMPDLLIYREPGEIEDAADSGYRYQIAGKSCLAGDIFGDFYFTGPLSIGDRLMFRHAAGYTMVKKNWFNGVKMPAIVVKRLNGDMEVVKGFDYSDYVDSLS